VKAPETSDKIPRAEDSTTHEPQSPSGTKSSPNLLKALTPQKASPGTTIPSPSPIENPHSSELAHSPNTTPPSPRCHGLGSVGEAPIGGDSAQPQLESIPR
jgi:hypothetical protein